MSVAPHHGQVVGAAGQRVEGGDGDAAVSTDQHAVLVGEVLADQLAGAQQSAEPPHTGPQRLAGFDRHVEGGREGARQVAGDGRCAVDEEHRACGR